MNTPTIAYKWPVVLTIIWCGILVWQPQPWQLLTEYSAFSLLGIVGAIFANATGAGGGVVFVPFFNQLEFTPQTTVATSFAIQCCGMTAGAVSWWRHARAHHFQHPDWQPLGLTLRITVPCSVAGIWLAQWLQTQGFGLQNADTLHHGFGIFSVILAVAIFATVPRLKHTQFTHHVRGLDKWSMGVIGVFGGIITAYLSIGVGELLAVYLIMRGFNVAFAIASAVMLSAFSVWSGVLFHLLITEAVFWPVVLFAGAGAIVGGSIAKYLVLIFSATNLKLFFASWVLVLGLTALPF